MGSPRTAALIDSFTRDRPDPWVALFEAPVLWVLKQEVLASGAVDLDATPARATELLDAYVRSHLGTHARLEVEQAPPLDLPAIGSRDWRGLEDAGALAGRLVACGAHPFSTPDRVPPDLLDLALKMGWGAVVLQLLAHPDLPSAADLQGRRSSLHAGGKDLPWAHTLAFFGRARELERWLAQPDMDANATCDKGRTPLFYARNPAVLKILCAAGAKPDWVAHDGRTARAYWENPPVFLRGNLSPEEQQALCAALQDEAREDPCAPTTLVERLHRWVSKGPESWNGIPVPVQDGMATLRVAYSPPATPGKKAVTVHWGALGLLASTLAPHNRSQADDALHIDAWVGLARTVPQALLEHQSLPGVSDGWLLLAKMCQHLTPGFLGRAQREQAGRVVHAWSIRLLAGEPSAQHSRVWRLSVLKAAAALLDLHGNADRIANVFSDIIENTESEWPYRAALSLDLRREIAATALTTPSLRPLLPQKTTFRLDKNFEKVHVISALKVPWTAIPAQDQWESMLALYHETCRREERRIQKKTTARAAASGDATDELIDALEVVMRAWVSAGFMPDALQEHRVRGGLGMLAKLCPDIRSALLSCRLNQALVQAPPVQTRPRM